MTGQANFLQSLGWAVLNSLWQLALLWIIYQIITTLFRTAGSSFKSSLASALLTGGFAWFVYTFIAAFTNGSKTVISSAFIRTGSNEEVSSWLSQILPAASVIYLVLLLFPLLHFIRNYRYVQVIRKYGLTRIDVKWRLFVSSVAGQMNIGKKVKIWVSEFVSSPVTIGFLKPVILVPLAAINHLTPQQLEAVLLHELAHIRRFDYFINLIINFIKTILYFNPFVKAFVKIVEKEREKSCDEMVLQFQYNSYEYAAALLTLEKSNYENKPLALAAAGKKNELLNRVELIMGINKKPVFSFHRMASFFAGLLCILVLNAILLMPGPGTGVQPLSLTHLSSPLSFIDYTDIPEAPAPVKTVERSSEIINHKEQSKPSAIETSSFADYVSTAVNPELIQASLLMANVHMPELKKYQQEQVKNAIEASKKVLENVQWKAVEKSIADAFNQEEKEELKATYEKQMQKFDWHKWETDLQLAYNKIDWEKINTQLSYAVNQVRLDSIQTVYNKVISKLDGARKELSLRDLKGIPDTDITLKEIERKKTDVQRALNELKAARSKKIVHL